MGYICQVMGNSKGTVMSEEIAQRLKEAWDNRDKKRLRTKKQLQDHMGVSHNTIMRWFRSGNIDKHNLSEVANILDVDVVWLLSGKESVHVREYSTDHGTTERDVLISVYNVELSAGTGMTAPEYIKTEKKLAFDSNWLIKHNLKAKNLIVLRVAGDSMLPSLEDGDSVLIDKSKSNIIDRKIYAIVVGGECKIKRLVRRVDGSIDILSDNPLHNTETVYPSDAEHLHIIGQAVYRSGML